MDRQQAFNAAYEVEIDPEFPGNGDWGCSVFAFKSDGAVTDDFDPPWGTPVILRVTPESGPVWVGLFPGGGGGRTSGTFACPAEDHLCVVVDGSAYLVDVGAPGRGAVVLLRETHQVFPAVEEGSLLLAGYQHLVAIGPSGALWRSPRLVLDDLFVVSVANGRAVCSGYEMAEDRSFVINLETGERV
jgi:hypothetical protein